MENSIQQLESNKNVRIALMVVLVVLVGVVSIFVLSQRSQRTTAKNIPTGIPSPTPPPVVGSLSLSTQKNQIRAGQTVSMVLKGDSQGKDIAGFDILINYDPAVITVNQVTPLNKDFQISSFTKRKGEISITGTKSSGDQSSAILNNADLVTISVTPLKSGAANVNLTEHINNERTKFIDMQYKQYTPRLESLQLSIL